MIAKLVKKKSFKSTCSPESLTFDPGFWHFNAKTNLKSLKTLICHDCRNKSHKSCTWVQCATFIDRSERTAILFFGFCPKNTNLVEDVEILLPVKFCSIPFSGCKGVVENVSANQRPGRPSSYFSDRLEKHKLCRGYWDLASCQISLNSVQRFKTRSRKCLSISEARAAILFFRSAQKNTNMVEDIQILLPIKIRWIPISGFRRSVENVSENQTPGRQSCFFRSADQRFQRRSRKCLSQSEARAAILFFPIGQKNTNLEEDVEILLPV